MHAATPVTAVDGAISLESCLTAFFAPEAITWACPAELKVSVIMTCNAIRVAAASGVTAVDALLSM